jgi:hypothetical protein
MSCYVRVCEVCGIGGACGATYSEVGTSGTFVVDRMLCKGCGWQGDEWWDEYMRSTRASRVHQRVSAAKDWTPSAPRAEGVQIKKY